MNTVLTVRSGDLNSVLWIADHDPDPSIITVIEQGPEGPPGPEGTTNLDALDDLALIFEGNLI